ncbi:DsbA family oxidoreductase [Bartonella sp. LJL80]
MTKPLIYIDIVSDLVCPWCYLGRKRLFKALDSLAGVETQLNWKPFQLTSQMPIGGKPYQLHMKSILGSQSAVDEAEKTLSELGEIDGIMFDFEAIQIAPNTLDAHRVVYWASQDANGIQDKLVAELYSRYFEQGQNIGDHAVLVDAAAAVGMRADVVEKLLQTAIDRDTITQDIMTASNIGVRGVPCFILDQKFVIMGAQPTEVLADAIQQIADGFEPGTAEDR